MQGITLRVLGDYGPFSRMGKSIGYQIFAGNYSYLIDCGAPTFQQIGGHGLKAVRGLIITHCHDDHKRWFTDIALFNMYAPDVPHKLCLITSEPINDELKRSSSSALDRSLSADAKTVVDIPYESYIDHRTIGPMAKYRIININESAGRTVLQVKDASGNVIGPDKAKIIISVKTGRPRLLFRDPEYNEWVEPEIFYSFNSSVFYEDDKNIFSDHENGVSIEAINAPVWHGITSIGLKVSIGQENLVFSSDTVNDKELWKRLYTEKRNTRRAIETIEFEKNSIIFGDINDYIERIWSEERYKDAINAFNGKAVIHDIATRNSVVHTDYRRIHKAALNKNTTLLTHSPDKITSEWALSNAEKAYKIRGNQFYEIAGEKLYPLNASIYHKENGKFYVGYKNEHGKYSVCDNDGVLSIVSGELPKDASFLYNVDIYEDIAGNYLPKIETPGMYYQLRNDGHVELVRSFDGGSSASIVKNLRPELTSLSQ